MVRALAVIVAAIRLSRPDLTERDVTPWAETLREVARGADFDPLSAVAIVHVESGWHPEVVSANGEDFGLGQIRARYVGACRDDEDPRDHPSEACAEQKRALLDPIANLRQVGVAIQTARKLCRERARTTAFPRWVAAYQGRNYPKQNRWCVPGDKTWTVVRHRERLLREATRQAKKSS